MADDSTRTNIPSGAPWESVVGYSRAVRMGRFIAVSGSTAVSGSGDAYSQAKQCIEVIRRALDEAGASLTDVVRTRMYVTDIEQWAEVARAHREAFGDVMPATSMVEVARLIDPKMLVEIEADAIVAG
ncbi:MAG: RidA family protein [Gammaproteobacteria bacterium]|nr:RidA family protein [Gammaproteobacteria bacterium]MDH3433688.1 RidA family protein [Gammaproteobacteria bacterium]